MCLVFFRLSCLFIAALWSLAGKELTSWLLFAMFFVFLSLSHVVSFFDYDMDKSIANLGLPSHGINTRKNN